MVEVAKYVPNRSPVDAILLEFSNLEGAARWSGGELIPNPNPTEDTGPYLGMFVKTHSAGLSVARPGDYLFRNIRREFHIMEAAKFNKKFAKLRRPPKLPPE